MPVIIGPVGRGNLQYTALWKAAQRLTERPVKFGAVSARSSRSRAGQILQERARAHVRHRRRLQRRIPRARRRRLSGDPDRGAANPSVRPRKHPQDKVITPQLMVEVFNRTVKGLRAKTEVWAHSCWGNPSQQRMFAKVQTYKPALEIYNTVDADVSLSNPQAPAASISKRSARASPERNRHRRHRPSHVAGGKPGPGGGANPRRAQIHPAGAAGGLDRLRHGPRGDEPPHAFYKMVSIVLGTNMVRKELGFRRPNAWRPTSAIRWWCRQEWPSTSSAGEVPSAGTRKRPQGLAPPSASPTGLGRAVAVRLWSFCSHPYGSRSWRG